jgi:hypothetical protein
VAVRRPGPATDPAAASRLTITFAPAAGGGTRLDLVHDRLDGQPEIADQVEQGWATALDALAEAGW